MFWERQKGESSKAFAAFTLYRDAGPTRSLRKTAADFYGGSTANLRQVESWSSKWMWVARTEAYDAEQERARRLELEEYRREMNEKHRKLASSVQAKLVNYLNSISGEEFTPSQAAQLLQVSTQLERLAVGEPTEYVAQDVREEVTESGDANQQPLSADERRALRILSQRRRDGV